MEPPLGPHRNFLSIPSPAPLRSISSPPSLTSESWISLLVLPPSLSPSFNKHYKVSDKNTLWDQLCGHQNGSGRLYSDSTSRCGTGAVTPCSQPTSDLERSSTPCHSLIHSVDKYFLSIYCMPCPVLDPRDAAVNWSRPLPSFFKELATQKGIQASKSAVTVQILSDGAGKVSHMDEILLCLTICVMKQGPQCSSTALSRGCKFLFLQCTQAFKYLRLFPLPVKLSNNLFFFEFYFFFIGV